MKILKWAFIIWSVTITVLVLLPITVPNSQAGTTMFCAYNRIFVEFDDNGRRWGTMLLDQDGRPIPCFIEDEEKPIQPKGLFL